MDPEAGLTEHYTGLRHRMVARQIEGRGVSDPQLLAAMREVPRHLFVAGKLRGSAYEDRPLPIGEGQTISQPFIVARMAELAEIGPGHRVLEVGAGCGYAAAVFSRIARSVVAVEIRPGLADNARRTLRALGYENVTVLSGRVEQLDPGEQFDRILAAAAASEIPADFEERLNDGGRMVVPVGSRLAQHLWTVDRHGEEFDRRRHEAVAFVPLV